MKHFSSAHALVILLSLHPAAKAEWSGNIAIQDRYFFHEPLSENSEQHNNYLSLSAEPEYYTAWQDDEKSITFTPFVRIDQYDNERTHGDVGELHYQQVFSDWELRVGISKVFWGVAESQHLVDVINQTDNVENIDGEDKLGQPMIKASFEKDWGTIDIFVLPYFRERTYQDEEGRTRFYPVVDTDQVEYESSDDENNIDYAVRWFNYLGDIELGISYFDGTSREPVLIPGTNNNQPALSLYYPQMQQIGIDAQLTTEEWLWKLELISRDWQNLDASSFQIDDESFVASTAGFEYTFVGIAETSADIGLVVEHLYDDRDDDATSAFQNDMFTGIRLTMNDAESTEALLGTFIDTDTQEYILSLEASRRFSDNWTGTLEARVFSNIDDESRLKSLEKDDFVQLDIAYYF